MGIMLLFYLLHYYPWKQCIKRIEMMWVLMMITYNLCNSIIIILRYISLILYNVFSKCRVDCFTHYPYIIEWIVALCFYVYCILCTPFVKEVISWLRVLMQMIQFLQLNISNIFTLKKKMNCVSEMQSMKDEEKWVILQIKTIFSIDAIPLYKSQAK